MDVLKGGETMFAFKIMLWILVIPAALVMKAAGWALYGIARLASYLVGPVVAFMIGCGIYSAAVQNWRNALILGAAAAVVYAAYACEGLVIALLQTAGDGLLNAVKR